MQEVKVVESRYKVPLEDEINKLCREGWRLVSFHVNSIPQGLQYTATLKRKVKNGRKKA